MIKDRAELITKVKSANSLIQEITDYLGKNGDSRGFGRLRFPRGFIRTAIEHRSKLTFVEDVNLKANLSYALMTHDVLRWMVFNTDISGQAREMLIKEAVCILGNICDSISIFPSEYGLGKGSSFAKRMDKLKQLDVIKEADHSNLNWLWDKRNQEHIHRNDFREWSHYEDGDWYRSVRAYHKLRDGLKVWIDARKNVAE
ncbi:hypothetical protein [Sphingomonas sp. Mn802worker]|uniref:hypothetical protein n=1 Tax=Sphingomonas sp. Mn802worker TaxID=629773 RepID=UPI0012EA6D6C|nr:hypothetical protein [Sphingomonas sp. Mn802worker]